jgi:heme exporter protein C
MVSTMLTAMLLMTFCFWAYSLAVVFTRARAIVLEQESDTEWVRALAR